MARVWIGGDRGLMMNPPAARLGVSKSSGVRRLVMRAAYGAAKRTNVGGVMAPVPAMFAENWPTGLVKEFERQNASRRSPSLPEPPAPTSDQLTESA